MLALVALVLGVPWGSAWAQSAAGKQRPTEGKEEQPAERGAAGGAAAAAPAPAPGAIVTGAEVRGFRAFCDEWMSKLAERERFNSANITWEKRENLVVGEYVGYSREKTCEAREETGKDPIGKITYRELRYRQQGATPAEAMRTVGTIVDEMEVTEIFRFGKGRWQY